MAEIKSWLDADTFRTVVDSTPLVSIDLLVRDSSGHILVGKRVNRPACGFWFVPGGRILKNETLADAFARLTEKEIGIGLTIQDAFYLGLYEHFYEDSIFTAVGDGVSTHYVVSGFEVVLPESCPVLPCEQHSEYAWLTETEFMTSESVHQYCRWYLDKERQNRKKRNVGKQGKKDKTNSNKNDA